MNRLSLIPFPHRQFVQLNPHDQQACPSAFQSTHSCLPSHSHISKIVLHTTIGMHVQAFASLLPNEWKSSGLEKRVAIGRSLTAESCGRSAVAFAGLLGCISLEFIERGVVSKIVSLLITNYSILSITFSQAPLFPTTSSTFSTHQPLLWRMRF